MSSEQSFVRIRSRSPALASRLSSTSSHQTLDSHRSAVPCSLRGTALVTSAGPGALAHGLPRFCVCSSRPTGGPSDVLLGRRRRPRAQGTARAAKPPPGRIPQAGKATQPLRSKRRKPGGGLLRRTEAGRAQKSRSQREPLQAPRPRRRSWLGNWPGAWSSWNWASRRRHPAQNRKSRLLGQSESFAAKEPPCPGRGS